MVDITWTLSKRLINGHKTYKIGLAWNPPDGVRLIKAKLVMAKLIMAKSFVAESSVAKLDMASKSVAESIMATK